VKTLAPLVVAAGAGLLLGACTPPRSSLTQRFAFNVSSDPGKALSGARLLRDGKPIATSDATGAALFTMAGHDGETFDVTVECPAGFQSPAQPTSVVLRRLANANVVAEYDVACTPKTRAIVVAVKGSKGHRLPVMHLGQEIARTDPSGVATVLLRVGPQEQFDLALDTSAQDDTGLRPQSPAATFSVKNSDEVLTFDPHFTELPKPAAPRPRRIAGPQRLPIRIQ
jgi:hypothetical protein